MSKYIRFITITVVVLTIFSVFSNRAYSQSHFLNFSGSTADSNFVFNSPRPLIVDEKNNENLQHAWGLDLLLSNNGFGAGLFYQLGLSKDLFCFASLYISGARNTDEFEQWDYISGTYRVYNKINRLIMFPMTIGVQNYLFSEKLSESFKPYVSAGFGPTFIISTPYEKEFFNSFGYANSYTRLGAFIGAGANVGGAGSTLFGVNIRYYYIPFGGKGLESIRDMPITDFGGIFLSLSLGVRY